MTPGQIASAAEIICGGKLRNLAVAAGYSSTYLMQVMTEERKVSASLSSAITDLLKSRRERLNRLLNEIENNQ